MASMSRNEEFDYGRVPAVLYHGAWHTDRRSIESRGLLGGHVTDNPDLAAEYGGDIYEVRKHPNIIAGNAELDRNDPKNSQLYGEPGGWEPASGVYWAKGVPPSHLKRVGHVIAHHLKDIVKFHSGGWTQQTDEIHWHKKEDCPLDYDNTHEDPNQNGLESFTNVRPHPTNPNLLVSDN
jgi:hypothetical protein